MELRVTGNQPRLLEEGAPAPPPAELQTPPEELEVPHLYWTPEKAQNIVARICHAGSKFYGPSVKAAEWELELIGDPAAAVLNDWLPMRVGASSDKTANLIALAVVVAIIVALRLPDILEVHGIIKPWKPKSQQAAESPPAQPASNSAPAVPAAGNTTGTFEPQLVGGTAATASDEKLRDQVYGQTTVGGGGSFVSVVNE